MTNFKVYSQKQVAPKCQVCKILIGENPYKRVQFGDKIIHWLFENEYLEEKEENNLEKIYQKFKSDNPA